MKEIRTLKPTEIDCRIGQVAKAGQRVSILLYKNARVDMAILDETFGPAAWQRDHKEIKGNLYCGVGIYQADTACWVWRWDCGVESNTEKEKGEASDAFKRACVNWGIGRELYTAPSIWIACSDSEWRSGKPWLDVHVAEIAYSANREITRLVIADGFGKVRYEYDKAARKSRSAAAPAPKAAVTGALPKEQKIFSPENYPVAWHSAIERVLQTGDLTRLDIEDRGFVVTDENWARFIEEVNSKGQN